MPDNENIWYKNVYLSSLVCEPLVSYLKAQGFSPVLLDGTDSPVYEEVSTHADIHMCQLGLWDGVRLFHGNTSKLGHDYPGNIIYNAVCTGKYFIHNLEYTDPELLDATDNLSRINVPQGYTRCCCLPVDDSSFITSDEGIAKALEKTDADVLRISRASIALPGFDYGFIGGCAGHITVNGRKTMIFNGDLSAHPDYKKIAAFIEDRDIDILFFEDFPLTDIGSILTGTPVHM